MLVVRVIFKAFALTGRKVDSWFTQGECPGLGASAPSGRVGWLPCKHELLGHIFNIIKYKNIKEIPFCVIFLAENFVLSIIICIFASSVPTKPLNDAQMRGAFFVYIRSLSKYANGKITALHETLYDRGRLDGSVEKSWACYFR